MTQCDLRKTSWLSVIILALTGSVAVGIEFAGGTGAPGDPYQIVSAAQLIAIGDDPNLWGKHFALTRDVDLAGVDPNRVHPIGGEPPFSGVFDGRDHTVANLHIVRKKDGWVGLFGLIGRYSDPQVSGHVRNLHLRNVNVLGEAEVGGLAGEFDAGTITNCSVTGVIAGKLFVGGLVGQMWEGEVACCTATVEVRGETWVAGLIGNTFGVVTRCSTSGRIVGQLRVGGLIGEDAFPFPATVRCDIRPEPRAFKRVTQCHSDCSVTGVEAVGGLIGQANSVAGIEDCYALGPIVGTAGVGGLIGEASACGMVRCFSAGHVEGEQHVGGLMGYNEIFTDANDIARYPRCQLIVEEVRNDKAAEGREYLVVYRPGFVSCFRDAQVSGVTRDIGSGDDGQGGIQSLTTAQMRTAGSFRDFGWDFENVWTIREGASYPALRWEQSQRKN